MSDTGLYEPHFAIQSMNDSSVEELEQRVAELEATVRGLTEELVDVTERVRQLEDGETTADSFEEAPSEPMSQPGSDEGEIHVADDASETPTEGVSADADSDQDDEAVEQDDKSEDSDDIIVA